jgi:siroheme synthase-like protein
MSYYPIFLDLRQRRCAVIGGGAVAARKVEGLLAAKADITVISAHVNEELRAHIAQGSVRHVAHNYAAGDLNGYHLAFVATDDRAINGEIVRDARQRRIWVNCADDPGHCDFILPAVIRRGELAVAVSTGGESPAAARAIREDLEHYLTDDFVQLVQTASEVRRDLRQRSIEASAEAWNKALSGDFRRLIQQGRAGEAKQLLLAKLQDRSCE